jgi:hypothetical protein
MLRRPFFNHCISRFCSQMRFYIFNRIPQSVVIRVMAYPILFYPVSLLNCRCLNIPCVCLCLLHTEYHHHSEHGQGLGLKTCSFEAQGVPGPSILLSVFPYPAIPEVGTGRPASVGGFYPFVPGGLPISFHTVLCPPLCCLLSNCYGSQGFSGGPIFASCSVTNYSLTPCFLSPNVALVRCFQEIVI